jgi:sec-independent protein translocase protein TatC
MANKKTAEPSSLQASINKYYPFLMEVRKRILFTLSGFIIGGVLGLIFYEKIISLILKVFSLKGVNIVFTTPFQFINLAISTALVCGLLTAFPLIIAQILSFLKPGLRRKEYRLVLSFLPFSIFLFIIGFAFGVLIMKWQVGIFLGKSTTLGIGNMIDITNLLSMILLTSALMGLGFQFPIVFSILIRLRVIKYEWLAKQRPWAYLASFMFAILLPPDSILADVLLTLPLVILFETTLILNRVVINSHLGELPTGE